MPLILLCIAVTTMLQSPALTGRVVDPSGAPIPGATVRMVRSDVSATVVSDETGRFRVGPLAAGPYLLTVTLAGFRTQALDLQVESSATPEIDIKLTPEILHEVLWVVPPAADAERMAAAIVHLRINETHSPRACGDAHVVTAYHRASALRTFKGHVPPTIELRQEAAGRCQDGAQWHEGIDRPYREGEEYVVFLAPRGSGFASVAGRGLTFRVRGEQVTLGGFAGVQGSLSLDAFGALLDRLSRHVPPPGPAAAPPGHLPRR